MPALCLRAFSWQAFRRFDTDGSGHLDEHECKNMQLGSAYQSFLFRLFSGILRWFLSNLVKNGAKGQGTTTWKRFRFLATAMGDGRDRGLGPTQVGFENGGAEVCILGLGLRGSKSY